jgi:hypothetical protein
VKNFKLDTKHKLDHFLKTLVENSVSHVVKEMEGDEKDRQDAMLKNLKGLKASDSKKDVEEGDEEEVIKVVGRSEDAEDSPEVPTGKEDIETKLKKEVTLTDLVDSLNLMRSGKSLKDAEIKNNIKEFFDGLTTPERQSMYVYINALAGIMTGTETGDEAADPQDVGIETQEKPEKETEEISTTVKTIEKGTEGAPIIVGEVAKKSYLRRRIRRLMER